MAAYNFTDKGGFYKHNPGTDVAVTQMFRKTTDKSRGVRLGYFVQIRTIVDEELEGVWSGKKAAKENDGEETYVQAAAKVDLPREPINSKALATVRRQHVSPT